MQQLYKIQDANPLGASCDAADEEEPAPVVTFELIVPGSAKVPAPRPRISTAALLVRPTSVTSTVHTRLHTQLRVNNTALATGWCTTATLTAAGPGQRARA